MSPAERFELAKRIAKNEGAYGLFEVELARALLAQAEQMPSAMADAHGAGQEEALLQCAARLAHALGRSPQEGLPRLVEVALEEHQQLRRLRECRAVLRRALAALSEADEAAMAAELREPDAVYSAVAADLEAVVQGAEG